MNEVAKKRPLWVAIVRGAAETFLPIALVLALVLGVAVARYGSVSAALGALRGQGIVADAHTKSLGTVTVGQTVTLPFTLRNVTSEPIRIVGNRTSCTCTVADDSLPIDLPPRGKRTVRVSVKPRAPKLDFRQNVQFYTDSPTQSRLIFNIVGTVTAAPVASIPERPMPPR